MHALVVTVTIEDEDEATEGLREQVASRVSAAPGFVAGYWTRAEGDDGLSMVLFESQEAARAAADRVGENVPAAVTLESVDVRAVVAHAGRRAATAREPALAPPRLLFAPRSTPGHQTTILPNATESPLASFRHATMRPA